MRVIRTLLAALAAAATLGAPAPAIAAADGPGRNYSDLWWNPAESGWGMNLVHQGDTAFATLFVYGPDGKPTWYFASQLLPFAEDASGSPALRGALYKAAGPWLGGAFDPSKVRVEPVGQLVIEPRAGAKLYVGYTAEGVAVEKLLERQTFATPDLGSSYHGALNLRIARPGGPVIGSRQIPADVLLHVDGASFFMRVEETFSRCEYRGTRTAAGRKASVTGTYACTGPESPGDGAFELRDFEVTEHGFTGYLDTRSAERHQYGRIGVARF